MRTRNPWFAFAIAVCVLAVLPIAGQGPAATNGPRVSEPAAHRWIGPDGQPLPFQTEDEVVEYLRKASIGKATGTSRGVSQPRKVKLDRDGVLANAIFHDINEERRTMQFKNETIMNFRDSYSFQIAAYELARLIGLNNVPPSVKRSISGKTGSLTMWLEGMTTEEMRRKANREPQGANALRWNRQMAIMHMWDALIYNFDRNQGNILIDKDWNVWLIDHTRSFRADVNTPELDKIFTCERRMYERIRALDKKEVEKRLRGFARANEIDYLMKRRDLIVARVEELVRKQGEAAVFFTYP